MFDIVVIGGGPAGVTAALRARELGASVALVERERLGGTCTNDGCVPTRVLAKAARLVRDAQQFEDYGLLGPAPELDFARLMSRAQYVVYQMHEKKQLIHSLVESGVSVYSESGPAAFVDQHTISLGDGQRLQAEKFIICTGGHARRLDFPGADYALTHSDVWSLKARPRTLIVVGAAATGCQVASIFSAFGTQVWLLERAERILRIEDPLVSEAVSRSFEAHGVQLITGIAGIDSIQKTGKDLLLTYKQGEMTHSLEAEAVILSSGWLGNVEPLNLEAAGVKHERYYILVDDFLRTSTPHIFAAGDVTGRMMLVQSAGYEALYAAENAVLGVGQPNRHLIVPHGGFTDPEYASVGMTEEKAQASGQEYLAVVVPYANMDRAVIDGRPEGFCKLIVSQENHRILGASVAGEGAVEIVHVVAAGMAADIWVEQLAELELAYPTFSAIIGLAAREAVYQLGVTPLATQWRALGRRRAAEWERDSNP